MSHFGSQANSQQNAVKSSLTVPVKTLPNMKFVDYLALQKRSARSICFLDREMGQNKVDGVFVDNIHNRIEKDRMFGEFFLMEADCQAQRWLDLWSAG